MIVLGLTTLAKSRFLAGPEIGFVRTIPGIGARLCLHFCYALRHRPSRTDGRQCTRDVRFAGNTAAA